MFGFICAAIFFQCLELDSVRKSGSFVIFQFIHGMLINGVFFPILDAVVVLWVLNGKLFEELSLLCFMQF